MALIPLYNIYGSWVLFSEAIQRLARESDKKARGRQARSALVGAMAMIAVAWGLQLADDLDVDIPPVALQAAGYARAVAQLATLGLAFSMMWLVMRKVADEGPVELEEGEDPHPLSRGAAGPAPGFTATALALSLVLGVTVYVARRESLVCGPGASMTTTSIGSGERALYCQKDGVPEGPWRVRTKNGLEEFTYAGGLRLGRYTLWYPDGKTVKERGSLNDKKKTGAWMTYASNGNLLEQKSYSNDVLEGSATKYHPNGKVAEQRAFHQGKLEGKFVAFHENGQKAEEGQYQGGEKVGHWTAWSAQGLVLEDKDYGSKAGGTAAGTTPGGVAGNPQVSGTQPGTAPVQQGPAVASAPRPTGWR
jgi:hypothetical protein